MRISDWSSDVCSSDLLSGIWPFARIYNYGLAASVTNCSVGSNVTLRYGGTRKDYQRINGTQPSIWAYARKAGLRTVYIEHQRTGRALQNMKHDDTWKKGGEGKGGAGRYRPGGCGNNK